MHIWFRSLCSLSARLEWFNISQLPLFDFSPHLTDIRGQFGQSEAVRASKVVVSLKFNPTKRPENRAAGNFVDGGVRMLRMKKGGLRGAS